MRDIQNEICLLRGLIDDANECLSDDQVGDDVMMNDENLYNDVNHEIGMEC